MQTNSVYNQHHVYFVTSNDSGLIWPSAVTNMSDRNMTNLWLWNCVCNPWKLSRINTFHSTRKYSEFFKVWVNLSLNWACFFSRWNLIRVNFFRCLACDCNYHDEKLCNVSKADCIARDILLSKLRSSWRFLKFSEALHVYSNRNVYVRNHVSQKAKGEISNWDAIANRETAIQVQAMFSAKQHPNCRRRWPEIQLR